ncbi:MAG: hypothetical protein ACEPOV_10685 [Hyphomicrobiales bacterium]
METTRSNNISNKGRIQLLKKKQYYIIALTTLFSVSNIAIAEFYTSFLDIKSSEMSIAFNIILPLIAAFFGSIGFYFMMYKSPMKDSEKTKEEKLEKFIKDTKLGMFFMAMFPILLSIRLLTDVSVLFPFFGVLIMILAFMARISPRNLKKIM